MIEKNCTIVSDGVNTYPGIRSVIESQNLVDYVLTYDDVNTIEFQHPLDQIALRLWGDSQFWFVLADLNPLRNPADWKVGDTIKIPQENAMTLIRKAQVR
jgi:hypothetical protein